MEAFVSNVSLIPRVCFRTLALAGLLAGVVTLSGCGTMSETNVHGIVVTESMLASVKVGTPQATVVDALGTPSTTSTISGEAYYYISQTTSRPVAFMRPHEIDRTVFVVYFDKGKVARLANYGMQDGKVFDFVARTTPTAGADLSFVKQLIRGLGAGIPGLGGH
jgi:outer membrane protein assembly factor BamE (lipoprotein component of BamABCDE complex)